MAAALGAAARPADTVFLGGGTPTLLDPAAPRRRPGRDPRRGRPRPGAEVTVEANPETVDPARARGPAGRRRHPPLARACRAPRRTSWPPSSARTRPAAPRRPRREARAAGFDHVTWTSSTARRARRDEDWRRTLDAALAPARPRQRLRADAGARHPHDRGRARRPPARARRGRPRAPLRGGRRRPDGRRAALVRGLQLGGGRRRALPPQPRLLAWRRTGGRSGPARTGTSAARASGPTGTRPSTPARSPRASRPRGRLGAPHPRAAPTGAGHARPAPRGGPAAGALDPDGPPPRSRPTASSTTGAGRVRLTLRGRCLSDGVIRALA